MIKGPKPSLKQLEKTYGQNISSHAHDYMSQKYFDDMKRALRYQRAGIGQTISAQRSARGPKRKGGRRK